MQNERHQVVVPGTMRLALEFTTDDETQKARYYNWAGWLDRHELRAQLRMGLTWDGGELRCVQWRPTRRAEGADAP